MQRAGREAHPLRRHDLLLVPRLLPQVDPEQDGRHVRVQEAAGLRHLPQDAEKLSVLPVPAVPQGGHEAHVGAVRWGTFFRHFLGAGGGPGRAGHLRLFSELGTSGIF